jgi:hypothetical protein
MKVYGVDFTSAPSARKPIAIAVGEAAGIHLRIQSLDELSDFPSFEELLKRPGPWIGAFDFPFGLSRQAVTDLGWPLVWSDLVVHCHDLGRTEFKRLLDSYRESRRKGDRYATRRGDSASGAHPSVKLVNPPVGFMFLEGAFRLAAAGLNIPGLRANGDSRIALEAYPGFLVRKQLGISNSYKSDSTREQTPQRRSVRLRVVVALKLGKPLGIEVQIDGDLETKVIEDGRGDWLDAIVCAAQAHWGWMRRRSGYGLPAKIDALEGWIVTA